MKVTNIFALGKKGLAKLKFVSKSKLVTPWPPTDAPPSSRTRGNKRKTSLHPAFATKQRVCYL